MRYEKQKGHRIKRYGIGIVADGLWYDRDNKVWTNEITTGTFSNTMPCKTVRAFRRALKKYHILHGRCRWINRYIGYDIYA